MNSLSYLFMILLSATLLLTSSCKVGFEPEVKASDSVTSTPAADVPFVLTTIADQSVNEGVAIAAIDADFLGADLGPSGGALTYSCNFDQVLDDSVIGTNSCLNITGLSFSQTTGVISWTPSFTQAGNYEFLLKAVDGIESTTQIFVITVANSDFAPVLEAVADQTVFETVAIAPINLTDTNGTDFDIDGEAITYSCVFDNTIDAGVVATTDCTTIAGFSINSSTGVISWTPTTAQSNTYEFKVTGTSGTLSDDEIFSITVNDIDTAPVMVAIGNQITPEQTAFQINVEDSSGGDTDGDGQVLTYNCVYDTTVDGSITGQNCDQISNSTFNTSTGVFDWTPDYTQAGVYELRITSSDGVLSDFEIFTITVTDVNAPPVLSALSSITVDENVAITPVDANDGTDDLDIDGTPLNYSCIVEEVDDVVNGAPCTALLTGSTFDTATGIFSWTPGYATTTYAAQKVKFDIKIEGTDGSLTSAQQFALTVNSVDRAAVSGTLVGQIAYTSIEKTLTLAYADPDGDLVDGDVAGETCFIDHLNGLTVTTACACDGGGVCTVGVTPDANSAGNAVSFQYHVLTNESYSNRYQVDMTVYQSMVSTWTTTVAAETISLPLRTGFTYDFVVNWGDGSSDIVTAWDDAVTTHTYATANTYTVTIGGTSEAWYFNNAGDKDKIETVEHLGELGWIDLEGAFHGCTNLTSLVFDDTSSVTTMSNMFNGAISLGSIAFEDTSSVLDMSNMFNGAIVLTTVDTTNIDTSSVTTMLGMFSGATLLSTMDVTNFNTISVTDMSGMFENATNADFDLSGWNFNNITTMATMLDNTNFSLVNYDLLLNTLSTSVPNSITLGATGLTYSDTAAHDELTGTKSWTINGDSL